MGECTKKYVGWIIIAIYVSFIIFTVHHLSISTDGKGKLIFYTLNASELGDFVGGFIGTVGLLISVVFIYMTYTSQREQIQNQEKQFQLQQFENRFFEMLKIARANSMEAKSREKTGRKVFVAIKTEVEKALGIIVACDDKKILQLTEIINVAYKITFYGADDVLVKSSNDDLKALFKDDDLIGAISFAFKAKLERKEFDGHQSNLGHYFRHLFQTVNYIDKQKFLTYDEKYSYMKTLRAQWSTHEQAIFFFNAMSKLGEKWELSPKITDDKKKLITKYNLIKNIPKNFVSGVDVAQFFPDIMYEYEGEGNTAKTKRRNELINLYKSDDPK